MIPRLPVPSDTIQVAAFSKRERYYSDSMDAAVGPENIGLDGGLKSKTSGDTGSRRLTSSDVGVYPALAAAAELLCDHPAVTAAAAKSEQLSPSAADRAQPPRQEEQEHEDDPICPTVSLVAKLERVSTGDSIVPLSETYRISSKEWAEYRSIPELGSMHPSMFMGSNAVSTADGGPPPAFEQGCDECQTPSASQSMPSRSDWVKVAEHLNPPGTTEHSTPPSMHLSSQPDSNETRNCPLVAHSPLTNASASNGNPSLSSSTTSTNATKKKGKRRKIDESRSVEPTDGDVLFGRGGYINNHPGNIQFREKALELRPWYEQPTTSKDEKYMISDLLVESVKSKGHRFLERGEDGQWHEVIGNGARKKASQALREHVKGAKRRERMGQAGTVPVSRDRG